MIRNKIIYSLLTASVLLGGLNPSAEATRFGELTDVEQGFCRTIVTHASGIYAAAGNLEQAANALASAHGSKRQPTITAAQAPVARALIDFDEQWQPFAAFAEPGVHANLRHFSRQGLEAINQLKLIYSGIREAFTQGGGFKFDGPPVRWGGANQKFQRVMADFKRLSVHLLPDPEVRGAHRDKVCAYLIENFERGEEPQQRGGYEHAELNYGENFQPALRPNLLELGFHDGGEELLRGLQQRQQQQQQQQQRQQQQWHAEAAPYQNNLLDLGFHDGGEGLLHRLQQRLQQQQQRQQQQQQQRPYAAGEYDGGYAAAAAVVAENEAPARRRTLARIAEDQRYTQGQRAAVEQAVRDYRQSGGDDVAADIAAYVGNSVEGLSGVQLDSILFDLEIYDNSKDELQRVIADVAMAYAHVLAVDPNILGVGGSQLVGGSATPNSQILAARLFRNGSQGIQNEILRVEGLTRQPQFQWETQNLRNLVAKLQDLEFLPFKMNEQRFLLICDDLF